jgi:hypothetical protein
VDWRRLVDGTAAAEALRDELRPHLRTCGPCREAALRADPSLLFAALPATRVAADELAEMQQRIAGARRLVDRSPARAPSWTRGRRPAALRAAAMLLPALAVAGVWGGLRRGSEPVPAETLLAAAAPAAHALALEARLDGLPLVDRAEEGGQEIVYQLEGASFDLVLLVDSALELGGP